MLMIYLAVRKQSKAADRWRFESTVSGGQGGGSRTLAQKMKVCISSLNKKRDSATGSTAANRMERAVVSQSVFYLCAFFVAWPIYLVAQLKPTITPYTFWAMVVTLTPLQGFMNFCVFIRPRIVPHFATKKRDQEAAKRKAATKSSGTANSNGVADASELTNPAMGHTHKIIEEEVQPPSDFPAQQEKTNHEDHVVNAAGTV